MAKPTLEIALKKHDTTFKPGEEIAGEVILHHGGKPKPGELTLDCEWFTSGKGNTDSGRIWHEALAEGERTAEHSRYPFSFPAPKGPFTYHGTNLDVQWRIKTELDLPWAVDPRAEASFGLAPSNDVQEPPEDLADRYRAMEGPHGKAVGMGCGIGIGLVFTLFPMIHLTVGLGILFGGSEAAPAGILFVFIPLIFIGVGLSILYFSVRNYLAAKKLGQVTFTMDPERPLIGDDVHCRLRIEPQATAHLNSATVKVSCMEVCTRGGGKNKSTYRETLFEDEHILIEGGVDLISGVPFERRLSFTVPTNLPTTFHANSNRVAWNVEVNVDVAKWPDWGEKRPLLVWAGHRREAPGF